MRVKYQRAPITTEWTVGAKANTGDGILAAEKLGAALDVMEDAWWGGPTVPLVDAPWFALSERNSPPGSIIVNMSGKRFMNESMPYVEACHHMYGGQYGQVRGRVRTSPPPGWCSTSDTVIGTSSRDCNRDSGFRRSGWSRASSSRPRPSMSWPPRPACPPTR